VWFTVAKPTVGNPTNPTESSVKDEKECDIAQNGAGRGLVSLGGLWVEARNIFYDLLRMKKNRQSLKRTTCPKLGKN